LNHLLREHGFDDFAEGQCATFYAARMKVCPLGTAEVLEAKAIAEAHGHEMAVRFRFGRKVANFDGA
jgi:hypothetical protein